MSGSAWAFRVASGHSGIRRRILVNPPLAQHAETPDRLKDGRICWQAEVIPASAVKPATGKKSENAQRPRSSCRRRAATPCGTMLVTSTRPTSRQATQPRTKHPPSMRSFCFTAGWVRLVCRSNSTRVRTARSTLDREATLGDGVRHVFVIRVENGRAAYRYYPAVRPGEQVHDAIPSMTQARPLAEFTRAISDELAAGLINSGLYAKEARAMVNTWTASYFQTEGVRVLFVLPQSWTDAFIPMTVSPTPQQIVRVMVGRLELLTAERERLAEDAVRNLAGGDSGKRQDAFRFLHEQGRYVEPIVRRVMKTTTDDAVRTLCRRLLLTDFLTELRAAVHNAADGNRLTTDPFMLRAHLARLLREVGSDAEARDLGSGHPGRSQTISRWLPNQALADNPAALEIRAAAIEATGDDRKAAADLRPPDRAPDSMIQRWARSRHDPWLRDWWVGRAYGQCVLRTPQAGVDDRRAGKAPEWAPLSLDRPCRRPDRLACSWHFSSMARAKPRCAERSGRALAAKPKPDQAAAAPALKPKDPGQTGT